MRFDRSSSPIRMVAVGLSCKALALAASVQPKAVLVPSTFRELLFEVNVELASKPEMKEWWCSDDAAMLRRVLLQNVPMTVEH